MYGRKNALNVRNKSGLRVVRMFCDTFRCLSFNIRIIGIFRKVKEEKKWTKYGSIV